jgi:hypothetical protein
MLNGPRPYRLAAVLVPVLVLLLGMGGPTLLHLCGMGALPATAEALTERPAVPPCHGGMPAQDGDPEAPVAPEGPTMQTCCLAVAAVPADLMAVDPAESLAPLVALMAPFASTPVPMPAPTPRDTGPLPPSVRSHLALSVLLL